MVIFDKSLFFKNHKLVESNLHVYGISDQLSCAFYWHATADILTKLLQQCLLFFAWVIVR